MHVFAADAPDACAQHGDKYNLLDKPGWKRLKRLAHRQKKMIRMANQAKLRSFRTAPKYKCGFEVPKDYDDAVRIDRGNGNRKWQDAIDLEFKQLMDYDTFHDLGYKAPTPDGYKPIRVHLVFDVKHDGRHKA